MVSFFIFSRIGDELIMVKKTKVKINAPNNRIKTIAFKSTKSNIRKILEASNYKIEYLEKKIGQMEVREFLKIIANEPKYEHFFKVFGKQKMSEFLESNKELFLEILSKEIYK